ncbi:hypothetical protein RHGRI_037228 [Rhododendron griersonianum]|uniref:Uncharacterized protein n=1 Tax=Rhododendron griersonianum TaxID=479676 RepID=A0AAV6HWP0_9ERIC|nr:hypothetical protein RHGRI_037228 [Rhododendron griersonianum]
MIPHMNFLLSERDTLLSTDCNWFRRFWLSSSKRSYSSRNPSDCFFRATALASALRASFVFASSSDSSCLTFALNPDISSSKILISFAPPLFPSSKIWFCFFTASMVFLRMRSSLI